MIYTEFLLIKDHAKFGDWLAVQDQETQQLYFGVAGCQHVIESLMQLVLANPDQHNFLVALSDDQWVGTVHIVTHESAVEFGIIVDLQYRGQGIASNLLEEAILWARNRRYTELYMHCLGWNKPIQHLCHKHGLSTRNMLGDSEVEVSLKSATWATINQEICIKQRNLYHACLQTIKKWYQQIYG